MTTPAVPADNPVTDAKVALGHRLFYDADLSIDQRLMAGNGVICSTSRSGNVPDNAAMENVFSSMKTERKFGSSRRTQLHQYLSLLPHGPMRRLLPFLACLMLVLTAWVGVAHAAEIGGCIETSQYEAASHVDGDGDQVVGDADKGYPHHHGSCHAHHTSAPDADTLSGTTGPAGSTLASFDSATLVGRDADATLRPPQA